MKNIDARVVDDFGLEWSQYDQSTLSAAELQKIFEGYFSIFPWSSLPAAAAGIDVGCGSGRWAKLVAPKVGFLHCVDPSPLAVNVTRNTLAGVPNCMIEVASANDIPLPDNSLDFGYSLGVLHHTPNTERALAGCVRKLKPGAPFLLYLYYALDNRPWWFRAIWRISNGARLAISALPFWLKLPITRLIAAGVYWPLARLALLLEKAGIDVSKLPLSFYRNSAFYTMKTDALDRFGTRLEQRFTRKEMHALMQRAGLRDIVFSENEPFWCAVGHRTGQSC